MSYVIRKTVDIVTAADGSATVYTDNLSGVIDSIQYVKDGSNGFSNGVDFTITTEETARNIWVESDVNASKVVAPRQPTHDTVGAASLYASGGEPVESRIAIANERLKFVIASGGNAKAGRFHVTMA